MLPTVRAIRYVAPLREGGSMPGIMEADDEGTYVVKYRGAGQGPKALVAEVLAGEIGRALDLPVPDAALIDVAADFGRLEVDYEIGHLLRTSEGINYALDYLPGSITYDPLVPPAPDSRFAADVVWFDAFTTNPDRTARNANMLEWHGRIWLIDHGAALFFHHAWDDVLPRARDPFERVAQHVLLPFAADIRAADARARERLSASVFEAILADVPDSWLEEGYRDEPPAVVREHYFEYLVTRLEGSAAFVEEAARG
jgi:HipA-like kinase